MKRKLEKPEVKIVKLQRMDVIATSGENLGAGNPGATMAGSKAVKMTGWKLQ